MAYWKRELPGLDEELFGLFGRLQRAGRIFDKDVERSMKQNGLKVSEFLVLGALRRIGPPYCLTPTELFKSLLITSGTITKQIDRLQERALVERRPDPSDRRGTLVCLTSLGKETVDNAVASPGEEQYRWLVDVLTPVERKVLIKLLRKLLLNREKLTE
jgi:DNA-binding MarR family transcriptional regulator